MSEHRSERNAAGGEGMAQFVQWLKAHGTLAEGVLLEESLASGDPMALYRWVLWEAAARKSRKIRSADDPPGKPRSAPRGRRRTPAAEPPSRATESTAAAPADAEPAEDRPRDAEA